MKKTFVQILKEVWEEKRKYFEDYRLYCQKIKEEAHKLLGTVEVLVFGSVVKGTFTPQSDIDVLVISENLPEDEEKRNEIKTFLKSRIDPFSPFQIHLATPEEFQQWYKRFIKQDFERI